MRHKVKPRAQPGDDGSVIVRSVHRAGDRDPGPPVVLLAVHSARRAGAELSALQDARDLALRFELIAAVPEGPLRAEFSSVARVVGGPATVPLVDIPPRPLAKRIMRNLIDLTRWLVVMRRYRIQLVVTNSSVVVAPVLAARLLGIPSLVHARDVTGSRMAGRVLAVHKRMASTIVALSGPVEEALGAGSRARIVRIYQGVRIPSEGAAPPVPEPRARPLLAVIGTVERRKGQDLAVEALAILRARGLDLDLVIIGHEQEHDYVAALRSRASALGLGDRVTFTGSIVDVERVLTTVDVLLGPSRAEPLGLALMEGMALGKPVVAARVGGIPEFIEDGISGLLVEPESPAALADAVQSLLADPAKARALGAAGRARIQRDFTFEQMMRSYGAEVDRLLAQRATAVRR